MLKKYGDSWRVVDAFELFEECLLVSYSRPERVLVLCTASVCESVERFHCEEV